MFITAPKSQALCSSCLKPSGLLGCEQKALNKSNTVPTDTDYYIKQEKSRGVCTGIIGIEFNIIIQYYDQTCPDVLILYISNGFCCSHQYCNLYELVLVWVTYLQFI